MSSVLQQEALSRSLLLGIFNSVAMISSIFSTIMLKHDEDTANPEYQAMQGRCFSFLTQLSAAGAFAGPELVAIPE